jgi:hypothetical protein
MESTFFSCAKAVSTSSDHSNFSSNFDKGCPDHLSEHDVDGDDGDVDSSSVAVNSPANPCCQRNSSQPFGYLQRHTLAHVAANHEAVMQYTNSQWNSRLHSDFQKNEHQIDTNWCE